MVLEGPHAVAVTRATMGKTKPVEALPGTIRGDLGLMIGRNLIHGSDGPESAAREVALFFGDRELASWARDDRPLDSGIARVSRETAGCTRNRRRATNCCRRGRSGSVRISPEPLPR